MATHSFRITRSSGEAAAGRTSLGSVRSYEVELDERMTVLDGLVQIQREKDSSLAFRCSCRVGMCGTCAMLVNYEPRLACQTRVAPLKSSVIHIAPLDHLPVIKDLVVSLEPFFDKWKQVKPALHPAKKDAKELAIVPPDSEFGQQAQGKRDCITCGACYSACSITGSNSKYLGPAAINRGLLRLLDPRDNAVDERVEVLNAEQGVWRCHTQFNCVAACPKGINLTDSIVRLKRAMLKPKTAFHGKLAAAGNS
ncbi:MAG: succinate dehydrogenase / fumarate reductase, iron-sulfur subunit [Humisphaera sp.]|nr:succinate dehydrogenase / fumarate reductase, iron-sulfur subunit [Humisphaera sp.]